VTALATREALLTAAHELLTERGGGAITVSDIAGRAGVNVAMVKYCFGNKDGLMLALATRITDSLRTDVQHLADVEMDPREKLTRHVREVVRNYHRYPYLTRLLTERFIAGDEAGNRALSESLVIPMAGFHRELLGERVDSMLFFFSVVGMCEFLFAAEPWLVHGFGRELDDALVERYAEHVASVVDRAFGALTDDQRSADRLADHGSLEP
jgi:AcrR family transcriptional regulator